MRIALSALAFGATALAALPAAAGGDNIVKQGAEAAGSTAGYMAGTVVGGPIVGAVGGVIGGAATRTTMKVIGAVIPGGKKKKAEVEPGDVQPQPQGDQPDGAAPRQQVAQQQQPQPTYLGTLAPIAAPAYANDAVTTQPLPPVTEPQGDPAYTPAAAYDAPASEGAYEAPESTPYAPESPYPAAGE